MPINEDRLYKYVGERLKLHRLRLRHTQEEMAQLVNVSRTSITNIEAGIQKPPLHVIYELCHKMQIEPGVLLPAVALVTAGSNQDVLEHAGQAEELGLSNTALLLRELSDRRSQE